MPLSEPCDEDVLVSRDVSVEEDADAWVRGDEEGDEEHNICMASNPSGGMPSVADDEEEDDALASLGF